ncbi:hypothetical protein [Novosphingobium album (ex Liu et al. 2023)]|uniref:Glycosyltransferase RgtA/B/C/D-like domain-containing protein n=1 Tax=Novosphingobium album (ex Liu et al. 2023) TaxID=3031130 RepID=A0ABT5WNQ2_9SPHN|nr:hypothetical protein [Novosphingobium album (ex Liu et al. 2023)]MDE8651509.1 hypothetical protein [Novosphingobium album (ex Liu et al. 2023)]
MKLANAVQERAAMRGALAVSPRWALLLVLLALVPLLYPSVPPLTDLPAHMARFMVQLDQGRSADIARWYHFRWNLIPNLGTDLLAEAFVPLFGIEGAMKALAMLIVGLQSAGYLLLARAAHGRIPVTALFALPLAYGNPFQYGFLNFTLGIALATLALALWISPRMAARPLARWALFCVIGSAIWLCHLAAWATLCILVGACELASRHERSGRLVPSLIAGVIASSCLLVPQALSLLWPDTPAHLPTEGFFDWPYKLLYLANVLADRWAAFDVLCALALFGLAAAMWRLPAFALHRGLTLGALVLLAIYLLMPAWVYGSFYADMRMVPITLAIAILAARPTERLGARGQRILAVAAIAFMLVRLAGTTASMAMWDRRLAEELKVLDHLPRGSQLVSFSALPCRTYVLQGRERNMHIASYALTRRHAFASDQFAMSGGQLLSIANPVVGPFDRDPSTIEIGEPCQGSTIPLIDSIRRVPRGVPYLWIIWHVAPRPVPGWQPFARSGDSFLYRRSARQGH